MNMNAEAEARDQSDELSGYRYEFYTQEEILYLDGNSLGLLSRSAELALLRVLDEWKQLGVSGWTDERAVPPWFFLAEKLAAASALLVGASADEVIVTNSTTVNLHQLLATLLVNSTDTRVNSVILTDSLIFPSDAYAIDSFISMANYWAGKPRLSRRSVACNGEGLLDERTIAEAMTGDVVMAILPSVVYTTGQLLDLMYLTEEAQKRDVLIGFDLSHSVGVLPHALSSIGADFAFWCGYKYLNGGPGATAGLYLNNRHAGVRPGLAGWFSSSKETQLAMEPELQWSSTASALQIGTPGILSMAPLCGSLATIESAGMDRVRAKSLRLTEFLIELLEPLRQTYGLKIVTPREDARRGGHVAIRHPEALRISQTLRACGVVPDFRPPDIIRLCPAPLYTTFRECAHAVVILQDVLEERCYLDLPTERPLIP